MFCVKHEILSFQQAPGTSLVVQWLRLSASSAGGMSLIPGQGTEIPHVTWYSQKKKTKKKTNKLSHAEAAGLPFE